jgi:uncharacterized protein YdiU (UPF0061 family)
MGVGFIHGVMNTDNMTISGETIDYGPCAFLDAYHPGKVFSSIDQYGRYAFANQPQIAVWNLAQLATALLPLMPRNHQVERALEAAEAGDLAPFDALVEAVSEPFVERAAYMAPPAPDEVVQATFCGT